MRVQTAILVFIVGMWFGWVMDDVFQKTNNTLLHRFVWGESP
jgi:hypothetical protein